MTLAEREEVVLKGNACAKCLSWKHERSTCTALARDCPEPNCGRAHHSLLHGTQHQKIMTIKKVTKLRRKRRHLQQVSLPSNEGMLEMCHYVFEDVNIGTTFLFDGASTTCLITAKLARLLCLKGKRRWVSIFRQGDKEPEVSKRYHYTINITTNTGVNHKVQFVEVEHISDLGPRPIADKLYQLFPHLPSGALELPIHDVGILIGQNAAALLPTGGDGKDLVGNLRLLKIPFGKGYTVGGFHPEVKVQSNSKANLYRRAQINYISTSASKRILPNPAEFERSKQPKEGNPMKKSRPKSQAKPNDYSSHQQVPALDKASPTPKVKAHLIHPNRPNLKQNKRPGMGSQPVSRPPYNPESNPLKPCQPLTIDRPNKRLKLSMETTSATSEQKSEPPHTFQQLQRLLGAAPPTILLPLMKQVIADLTADPDDQK